jgi:hypothetical protein
VRFFHEAFAAEPKLTCDPLSFHRYNAPCAAALAGCGQGKDADKLDSQERARLRQQALDWLRDELKACRQMLRMFQDEAGPTIARRMQYWLQDTDFAGVRGADALAGLPKAERQEWEKLWQEVEALRQRAAERPATARSTDPRFFQGYNAACAAALAGCGQGKDADKLDSQERARLRQQALDWLRDELKACRQVLEKSQGKAGPGIAKRMQHWLRDPDFAGVRGADALARLPKAERQGWENLWQEVEALWQRAAERPTAASSARP